MRLSAPSWQSSPPGLINDPSRDLRLDTTVLFMMALGVLPTATFGGAWGESQELLAYDGERGDGFGLSMAISGEVAMFGAPLDDNMGGWSAGAVYVFVRDAHGGSWSWDQKLVASDGSVSMRFGYSVAMSGDVAVIGAPQAGPTILMRFVGAAYVFVRDALSGAWSERQKLGPSTRTVSVPVPDIAPRSVEREAATGFGYSVAVAGEVVVVGAEEYFMATTATQWENPVDLYTSAPAYVFVRDASSGAWSEAQQIMALEPPKVATGRKLFYKSAVATTGENIVVGLVEYNITFDDGVPGLPYANAHRFDYSHEGAAHVFVHNATSCTWSRSQRLTAGLGFRERYGNAEYGAFGYSVAAIGERLMIGEPIGGKVYIFERDAASGAWSETQRLTESENDKRERQLFGKSVALSNDVAVVGSPHSGLRFSSTLSDHTACPTTDPELRHDPAPGSAHVFVRDAISGVWTEQKKLEAIGFGCSVAAARDAVAVGRRNGEGSVHIAVPCNDFGSVVSVRNGSCTSCDGPEPGDCLRASCDTGFSSYNKSGMCTACNDVASVGSVKTRSCGYTSIDGSRLPIVWVSCGLGTVVLLCAVVFLWIRSHTVGRLQQQQQQQQRQHCVLNPAATPTPSPSRGAFPAQSQAPMVLHMPSPPHSPVSERSFATSQFKAAYMAVRAPEGPMDLGAVLSDLIHTHCEAQGIPWSHEGLPFLQRLQREAMRNMDDPIDEMMQRMWTSALQLRGTEFCSILNYALRGDTPELAESMARIVRGINALCVSVPPRPPFPQNDMCYRGGGFDEQYRSFFVAGREFRQPAYFATSFSRAVADRFIARAVTPSKVRWHVRIDAVRKCAHVNLLRNTNVPGEEEYLFAPYSVFTVMSASWTAGTTANPHVIELAAAHDNTEASEALPLAPWS